jgi:hypothetical protein
VTLRNCPAPKICAGAPSRVLATPRARSACTGLARARGGALGSLPSDAAGPRRRCVGRVPGFGRVSQPSTLVQYAAHDNTSRGLAVPRSQSASPRGHPVGSYRSRFPVHGSPFTVPRSRFPAHGFGCLRGDIECVPSRGEHLAANGCRVGGMPPRMLRSELFRMTPAARVPLPSVHLWLGIRST